MSRLGLALPTAVLVLGACATIAGLESAGPPGSASLPNDQDGGSFPVNDAGAIVAPVRLPIETRCGLVADTAEISIKNSKEKDSINYKVVSANPSVLTLIDDEGASKTEVAGVIPGGQLKRIKTRVNSSSPGTTAVDLDVTTDGVTQQINAELSVKGGKLSLTPALIDFGQVRQNKPTPPQDVVIANTGNEPVTIENWTLADGGAPDFVMQTGSVTVMPGAPATRTATFNPGLAGPPLSASFVPKTLDPTCTDPPGLTLKGERVSTNVTVTPGSVSVGTVGCNGTPNGAALELRNYANEAATFNVSHLSGAQLFTFPTGGSIAPGSDATPTLGTIPLTPLPAGSTPGDPRQIIRIHFTTPADVPDKDIELGYRIVGALLQFSTTTLGGYTASGQVRSFRVTNVGNEFVFVRFSSSNNGEFGFSDGNAVGLYDADEDFFSNRADIGIKMNATAAGPHSANITMARTDSPFSFPIPYPDSGRLCNNPIPVVAASGTIP